MILDAHHHLWSYSTEEYGWIGEGMERIARDFTAEDLRAVAEPYGVVGSIAVQARQTLGETTDLLRIANGSDFVRGVVGWLPLREERLSGLLDELAAEPKLKGLRHVVQDEPDDDFLLLDDFNRGVAESLSRGLTYDILIFERQLPAAVAFADRHPDGRLVVDHLAKPGIAAGAEIGPWKEKLTELAKRPNVSCKLSGVVTEADWKTWTAESLRPYFDAALEAFGPGRLMYGSDWPVCLLASEYDRWFKVVNEWAASLSPSEQQAFYYQNTIDAYQLQTVA